MQQRMAEESLAVLQVELQRQDVGVPVGIAVAAGHDVFAGVVADQLQEAAILEFDRVQFFERPVLLEGDQVGDGFQVQREDVRVERVARGRVTAPPARHG